MSKIFVKISMITTLIILISIAANLAGILDMRYTLIIVTAGMVIQGFFIILNVMTIVIIRRKVSNAIRMVRHQFNDRIIIGNKDIIPGYVSSTNPIKPSMFKVLIEIEKCKVLPEIGISKISDGQIVKNIKNDIININFCIIDDNFLFDASIIVKPGEKINFQIKEDTMIKSFLLGEIYIP